MLRTFGIVLLVSGIASPASSEPTLRSSGLVKELTNALAEKKLDAIAARDPDEPDRYVAALFFPDAQLLVVSARYAAPPILETRLSQKQYRDVYLDLQGSPLPNSSWFFQDMKADGLCSGRDETADVLYGGTSAPTIFDGDWKKHNLSEQDYARQLSAADEQYTRLLRILLSQLKGT
jgi:hypothetical protein